MINDNKFLCGFYNYDCVLTTNINKTSFLCYGSFTLMLSGLGNGLGFRFQTRWLHCTSQNMFTLHRPDSDPTPYFYIGQESESESVSDNVNEPLHVPVITMLVNISDAICSHFRVVQILCLC